jgi:amino acid transporter
MADNKMINILSTWICIVFCVIIITLIVSGVAIAMADLWIGTIEDKGMINKIASTTIIILSIILLLLCVIWVIDECVNTYNDTDIQYKISQAKEKLKNSNPPILESKTLIYSLDLQKDNIINGHGSMGGGFLLGIGAMAGSIDINNTIEFNYYFYKKVDDGMILDNASAKDTVLVETDNEPPSIKIYNRGYKKLIIPTNTIRKEFNANINQKGDKQND